MADEEKREEPNYLTQTVVSHEEEDLGHFKSLEISATTTTTSADYGIHKGLGVSASTTDISSHVKPRTSDKNRSPRSVSLLLKKELGILAMHDLKETEDVNAWFGKLAEIIQNLPNTDSVENLKNHRVLMGHYLHGQNVELLLHAVQVEDEDSRLALDVRRMCGDAFIAQSVLRLLKEKMVGSGLMMKPEPSTVDSGETSDDEDDDSSFDDDLSSLYLKFSRDPKAVLFWIHQLLAEVNYQQENCHNMGLFEFNAENPENLSILVDQGSTKLVEVLLKFLPMDYEKSCTALSRSTAKLAKHCCTNEQFIQVLKESGKAVELAEALQQAVEVWDPRGNTSQKTFELTTSRQTTLEAVQALVNLREKCPELTEFISGVLQMRGSA